MLVKIRHRGRGRHAWPGQKRKDDRGKDLHSVGMKEVGLDHSGRGTIKDPDKLYISVVKSSL
jgi:hypothetical protein